MKKAPLRVINVQYSVKVVTVWYSVEEAPLRAVTVQYSVEEAPLKAVTVQ